jgi:hypothetical protein
VNNIKQFVIDLCNSEKLNCVEENFRMESTFKECGMLSQTFWEFRIFDILQYNIRCLLQNKLIPIEVNNSKKIEIGNTIYYWNEENDILSAAIVLYKSVDSLEIIQLTENRSIDSKLELLYNDILKNNNLPIISSGCMSDNDFLIWKKLLLIHNIFLVDMNKSINDVNKLYTHKDLEKYFSKENKEFRSLRFMIKD